MKLSQDALSALATKTAERVLARAAVLKDAFGKAKHVAFKDARDQVTEHDVAVEDALRGDLKALLSDTGFTVEEGTNEAGHEYTWVIDPIDQTKNFVGGIPLFFTQVALLEGDVPVIGVIYNPISEQLFVASRGNGATLGGAPLAVRPKERLEECIVDLDFGGQDNAERKSRASALLATNAFRVRVSGGAYAPYLGTGGIDAFVQLSERTKLVDWAPRQILVQELGFVVHRSTGALPYVCVGSQPVVDALKKLFESIT